MTQLAAAVDAVAELWTLDSIPATRYVQVDDETVEVRSPFPSQTYTLTGQEQPPRIRVRRGVGGTTAASHNNATTLTPVYVPSAGGGGGAIAVDNTVDAPVEVATLIVPGVVISGDEAAMPGRFYAQATDPGLVGAGAIWKNINAGVGNTATWWERNAADDGWDAYAGLNVYSDNDADADASPSATSDGDGNAMAGPAAVVNGAGSGYAYASPGAIANGDGSADAGPSAVTFGAGDASTVSGASANGAGDADTTATSTAATGEARGGVKAIRGADEASLVVKVTAAGLKQHIMVGLPTADPTVAGQLWNDTGTLKVSAG